MTTTAAADRPLAREDLQMFDLMHGAMRAGSRSLRAAVAELAPFDRAGARQLRDYYTHMHAEILQHHTVEDEVFFPGLVAKVPATASIEVELHEDHVRLDRSLDRTQAAFDALVAHDGAEPQRRTAEEAADELSRLLDDHLDREEAAVLPAFLAAFTAAEYGRLDDAASAYVNKKEFPFVGPWLLAGATEDEAEWLFGRTPKVVRWLYRWSWKPKFDRAYPLIVGRVATRRRPLAGVGVAALLLVVVAGSVITGCADDTSSASGHDHMSMPMGAGAKTVSSRPPSHRIDVSMGDFTFTSASASVLPGTTTVRVTNDGAEAHQLQIGRPSGDLTAENFAERYERDGEAAVLQQVTWVGGANALEPGGSEEALVDLVPGEYLMFCFMPSADGTSHLMKGMIAPLRVESGAPSSNLPTPDATIEVKDFQVTMPAGFTGKGLVEMRNVGEQAHEVILVRANDGSTIADAFAWYGGDQSTPAPFTFAGGLGAAEPGASSYARLDLPPGDYAAVCFLPDVKGDLQPHVTHGMAATFTIA